MTLFDWTQYHVLAAELETRTEEACLRSAVSRAYYAAFCQARNKLIKEHVRLPKTGDAHWMVWKEFRKAKPRTRKHIGTTGSRLHKKRKQADYDDSLPNIAHTAKGAVMEARQLLQLLDQLP